MKRFVILEHDHPTLHWDLMLERDGVLRTWRMPTLPTKGEMSLDPLPDHRLAYLDYEGPVSGNRGSVKRFDSGTYNDLGNNEFDLEGTRTRGIVILSRRDDGSWQGIWHLR